MKEQELRDFVRDHLDELIPIHIANWSWEPSLRQDDYDILLELSTVSGMLKAACEFMVVPTRAKIARAQERMARIRENSDHLPLLICDYLSEPLQAFCREAGVPYLDLSGNAWIEQPGLVIHRSSRAPRFPTSSPDRTPFADKASLVLRFLFAQGEAGGVRELARSVGLNPGYISRIVKVAEELGYVRVFQNRSIHLVAPEEVLGDWSSIYHWRKNRIRHFTLTERGGADSLLARLKENENAALTMHAGANLIDDYAGYRGWHIYCRTAHEQTALEKDLALTEVESGAGDVILMQPYYRESAFYGMRFIGGVPVVSDLQLYLDLFKFPVRGRDTAERILTRRLRHKIPFNNEGQEGLPDDES
ncbi:type IV toxin-antitoxin system AbiEi family antitoxin [Gemmatimonadota bacterium]